MYIFVNYTKDRSKLRFSYKANIALYTCVYYTCVLVYQIPPSNYRLRKTQLSAYCHLYYTLSP